MLGNGCCMATMACGNETKEITMKTLMCAVAVASMVMQVSFADGEDAAPAQKKVVLRIASCETPDSRLPEWKPPKAPAVLQKLPYSPEKIAAATPEKASQMVEDNARIEKENYAMQMAVELENWNANMEYMKGIRAKLTETPFGMQIVSAVDKFAASASAAFNPDCLEFFDTLDLREGNDHAKFQTFKSAKIHVETYFLKLFFDNPTKTEHSITLGDGPMTRTKWTQRMTFNVKDSGGGSAFAGKVEMSSDSLDANADEATEARVALIEKCLDDAAKKINDFFVATVVFKSASSVKGDEDFESASPTLIIDGVQRGFDEPIGMLKKDAHDLVAEAEGYRTIKKSYKATSSKTETLKFVPTTCHLTVNVKGPEGFDPSSATIELVGKDDATESLTAGEPAKVAQGKWTLKVTADGYTAKPKTLNLAKPKQVETVTVAKAAAPAAADAQQ